MNRGFTALHNKIIEPFFFAEATVNENIYLDLIVNFTFLHWKKMKLKVSSKMKHHLITVASFM
jgi:hypothetical protein